MGGSLRFNSGWVGHGDLVDVKSISLKNRSQDDNASETPSSDMNPMGPDSSDESDMDPMGPDSPSPDVEDLQEGEGARTEPPEPPPDRPPCDLEDGAVAWDENYILCHCGRGQRATIERNEADHRWCKLCVEEIDNKENIGANATV